MVCIMYLMRKGTKKEVMACLKCGGRAKKCFGTTNQPDISHWFNCKRCGFCWYWGFGKNGNKIGFYGASADNVVFMPFGCGALLVVSWREVK